MLNTMPGEEEWLVKVVKNIYHNVVVACAVDFGSWELAVD